ncbi:MAG: FeoC-like transcriptional regulator [Candidatus Promineifilaceae bacterium]|nr:FeoC-like transcriptional regulator [Candidatus Promineifilaceae bacterium]
MLTRLMRLLEEEGQLPLNELSQRLNAQPAAVAGMLELLRRKGRLVPSESACGVCDSCPIQRQCKLPDRSATRYQLVSSSR